MIPVVRGTFGRPDLFILIFNDMMMDYFIIGMFSTLSLNSVFSQMADHLFAGMVSIVGGVVSSLAVAWLKRRWRQGRH